jgi:hypothetical protein
VNVKQIAVVIGALAASALILWYSLPIDFPWMIFKVIKLFLMLFAVLAVAVFSCILLSGKKKTRDGSSVDAGDGTEKTGKR